MVYGCAKFVDRIYLEVVRGRIEENIIWGEVDLLKGRFRSGV